MSFHSGMNFETGSWRRTFPSSIIIRMATPTIGLVIDMMRKMPSLTIGFFASQIHEAVRLVMPDAPVARHQRHGAGEAAGGDVPLHEFGDSFQPFSR